MSANSPYTGILKRGYSERGRETGGIREEVRLRVKEHNATMYPRGRCFRFKLVALKQGGYDRPMQAGRATGQGQQAAGGQAKKESTKSRQGQTHRRYPIFSRPDERKLRIGSNSDEFAQDEVEVRGIFGRVANV